MAPICCTDAYLLFLPIFPKWLSMAHCEKRKTQGLGSKMGPNNVQIPGWQRNGFFIINPLGSGSEIWVKGNSLSRESCKNIRGYSLCMEEKKKIWITETHMIPGQ